jgi:MoCo/4Fe-4S cofactor protein with predicted Tat translocation signal
MSLKIPPTDLASLRKGLSRLGGRRYWRSLEELSASPAFIELLKREFPAQAAEWNDPAGRRSFLQLMGASLALAGVVGCTRQPEEKIVPYVHAPEELVPGRPLYFATALTEGGFAQGVLVESHMGRPTKVEGNPEHPASRGATDVFGQAAVLGLYDPDRAQTLRELGETRPWDSFVSTLSAALDAQRPIQGDGLRVLTETVTSPTLAAQLEELLAELPKARWHQYEPSAPDNARAGAVLAFGEPVGIRHHLETADVILSLEADFVSEGPARLAAIRDFASRRRPDAVAGMNRLYVVESTPSLTGAAADHRLPLASAQIEGFCRALAVRLGLDVAAPAGATAFSESWLSALARDLMAHRGSGVVMAGESQPPAVHALCHAINEHLGNVGRTVSYTEPVEARSSDQAASLAELAEDMASGKVDLLVILGGNPVFDAPADSGFVEGLRKVALRVRHGLYDDETSAECHWLVPATHPLESWGDARAFDGTVTLQQPLIAPLYEGKSAHELLATLGSRPGRSGYDIVREHWKKRLPGGDFEKRWRRAVHDGFWADTGSPEKKVSVQLSEWAQAPSPAPAVSGLELTFRLDPTIGDGRHANNGWLQELPKPLTKLTWDNALLVGPKTAAELGIATPRVESDGSITELVELTFEGRTLTLPAWVLPGQADSTVTVHLGYGRSRAGRVGNGVGVNAYPLRTRKTRWFGAGAQVKRTGRTTRLACTQDHWSMEGRHLMRSAGLDEYKADPSLFQEQGESPSPGDTLYPAYPYPGHAWGMAIDLGACVGCNACVVACQAENNIPVVGKDQVARGREMHWIRLDRYFEGDLERPSVHHQPVPCMQCENAPCELVCPVAATSHSDEGLNDMVYNRCVGTRYCSNNCPYKVRRFNFLLYQDWQTPSLKLQRNPDVTVRSRGVMEKCTYCVQRINQARIQAGDEGREIRDGEIRTACQAACPAQAIYFGDQNDPKSVVSQRKAEPRNYGLLAELNTRPRTTYLAAVKNKNPEIDDV